MSLSPAFRNIASALCALSDAFVDAADQMDAEDRDRADMGARPPGVETRVRNGQEAPAFVPLPHPDIHIAVGPEAIDAALAANPPPAPPVARCRYCACSLTADEDGQRMCHARDGDFCQGPRCVCEECGGTGSEHPTMRWVGYVAPADPPPAPRPLDAPPVPPLCARERCGCFEVDHRADYPHACRSPACECAGFVAPPVVRPVRIGFACLVCGSCGVRWGHVHANDCERQGYLPETPGYRCPCGPCADPPRPAIPPRDEDEPPPTRDPRDYEASDPLCVCGDPSCAPGFEAGGPHPYTPHPDTPKAAPAKPPRVRKPAAPWEPPGRVKIRLAGMGIAASTIVEWLPVYLVETTDEEVSGRAREGHFARWCEARKRADKSGGLA